ncbi:ABC transporter ATP-binding protein [uncultured Dubosiella sp.]|uniref:ABC transporter ATP-binding protein n=2 Tax=uncultured Dubosiella sp. TaxID=1937011 RepID=UPI00263A4765|nr:ABC transporter ATP-binding protein [uncultured Dubosiella sp.]
MKTMEVIKTDKLTKYYGKARGIIYVDLNISQGEFFGFIGPNGAGKSTTIRILLGLIAPSGGRAFVLGKDIGKEKEAILKETGYVPAEASFYKGMKVREILKLSADLRKTDCKAEAQQLCRRLQLDPERKVDDLSYGNKKKVAIVCALQHRPKLLILDEPTSGLDPLMQKEFFDILRERNKEGTTILLSSHVLSEIQDNCSRAAIVRDGTIIACGSVDELSGTNVKRVRIQGTADLRSLQGVRDQKETKEGASFLYGGSTKCLLETLAAGHIKDVTITEPGLEEVFRHYYEETGGSL